MRPTVWISDSSVSVQIQTVGIEINRFQILGSTQFTGASTLSEGSLDPSNATREPSSLSSTSRGILIYSDVPPSERALGRPHGLSVRLDTPRETRWPQRQ
jgi:hypothetical protein